MGEVLSWQREHIAFSVAGLVLCGSKAM